jgi:uncharacterized protein (TIGR02271 family)
MERMHPGMVVEDDQGTVGYVQEFRPSDEGMYILLRRTDGRQQLLAPGTYRIQNNVVHVALAQPQRMRDASVEALDTQQILPTAEDMAEHATLLERGGEVRIPVVREDVVIAKRVVEHGGVRVHKHVNEREEVVEQPTVHDEVDVERVPVGRVVDVVPEVREEGDTLIIPVMEEMLVVEKRLVLKEEIRVRRRQVRESEQARVVLRQEEVEIERIEGEERELGA